MNEPSRSELIAQAKAIQKQIDLLKSIQKPPEPIDLARLVDALFDRLDAIEVQLNRWDD